MPSELPRHFSVAEGDELAVTQALVGPIVNLEPVCPMCGHIGATRVERHRADERVWETPCYLTWCGAHGVTAAARNYNEMPPSEMVPLPKGGSTNAWEITGVRCGECSYISPPSAFCRPIGPVYGGDPLAS